MVYYPATNKNDEVKAIGIALQNDVNTFTIEKSIEKFEKDGLKRI